MNKIFEILIAVIIMLAIVWGGAALITYIFGIEDPDSRATIRRLLLFSLLGLGACLRIFAPNWLRSLK
jgi:Ca2+/Na+ antiporter